MIFKLNTVEGDTCGNYKTISSIYIECDSYEELRKEFPDPSNKVFSHWLIEGVDVIPLSLLKRNKGVIQ